MKSKSKPFLIELKTFRYLEHCGPNNDDKLNYIHLPNEIKEWNNSEVSKIEKILNKDLSKWKI